MAYDYDPNSDTMDTCVLDRILDLISLKAFEHEWPRYKDGMTQEELNTFYDKVESFLVDE